jgi:signal transduction histidine kinase
MKKVLCLPLLFFAILMGKAQSPELQKLQSTLPQIKDSLAYVDALNRIAMLLYEKNVDSTFYYTRQARGIADRLNYAKGKADAQNNLGVFFDIKGNLQLALRYYNEGYSAYKALKDSANTVQSLMNLAMVYKELGKDARAIRYFDDAMLLGHKLLRDSILSLAIYNYQLAYPTHFSHSSVNGRIAEAGRIASKYKDFRTLVALDQLVADEMIAQGNREQGLALLQRTIQSAIDQKLYYVSMDMLADLGGHLMKSDPAKAVASYRRGMEIAQKNSYLFYNELMTRRLFDFYTERGDSAEAGEYSRLLVAMHDQQEDLVRASGIDYLDYTLQEEQLRRLTLRSKYENSLLALLVTACLLAIAVMVGIWRNLRQARDRNGQMQKALSALEQSQADNSRMMKVVAHDLRNPIGAIQSIASIMLSESAQKEDDRAMLEMIHTSATNSLELTSDLLQVQFRTEELKKDPVDIAQMLQYCVSLLGNKAEAKGQQLQLETINVTLQASREKLWRVVSNLIANAIKFSPTETAIHIKMEQQQGHILISVKDQGIGIPAEMKDKIFDLFTEAKRTGTAGEQAFGLGLAISKQIVEAHGGRIWFDSEIGKGTVFYVELPVDVTNPA